MNPEVGAMMCVQGDLSTAIAISTRPRRCRVMKILFGDAKHVLLMAQGILPRLIRIDERQYASYKSTGIGATLTDAARATGVTAVKRPFEQTICLDRLGGQG